MNNPFDFFDKICCINLPDSKERKRTVSQQFEKVDILDRVEWIYAPPPPDDFKIDLYRRHPAREFGCMLSHLTAIVRASHEQCDNVLIFEDDITFTGDALATLSETISVLPDDWVGFYLGANVIPSRVTLISKRLFKFQFNGIDGGYAYAFNCKYFLEFFTHWTHGITHGLTPNGHSPMDVVLPHFVGKHGGYVIRPNIVNAAIGDVGSTISKSG